MTPAKKKALWVLIISLILGICSAGYVRIRQAGEDSFVASTKATLGPKGPRDGT